MDERPGRRRDRATVVMQPEPATSPEVVGSWRNVAATAYVAFVAGAGALILLVTALVEVDRISWGSHQMLPLYLLAGMLFLGEFRPLLIAREDGEFDRVTVSSTFALALILSGPLLLGLAAQGIAVAIDDLRRSGPLRAAFNASRHVLTLFAARLAFCLVDGTPVFDPFTPLGNAQLVPALAAAMTFFLINTGTVALAVSIAERLSIGGLLRESLQQQGMTSLILLGLGPVAAMVSVETPVMLPLLMLPIIGVQHSARLSAERQHEAMHDRLTGLGNRDLLRRRAEIALETPPDGRSRRVGIVLVDLDHFKEVNDTLGHAVGDGLLRQVALRLTRTMPAHYTVVRLGGDEFAVLVPDARSVAEILHTAETAANCLREPVLSDGLRMAAGGSVGIAYSPEHATDFDALMQRAEIALYRAKSSRGSVELYRSEIDRHTVRRLSLMGDLHSAVDNHEFLLLFQPQQDSRTGEIVAVEALMRWSHPSHGTIGPDVFIPLAENSGLIGPMSRRALESALETLALLRKAGHDVAMAVNISARLMSDLDLPRWINRLLMATSVPPSRLTIEITESTITSDPERAMQVLQQLRELGIRLSIDDFGTGYSSLSYLRRLQPDELKVDKSFVIGMNEDENSAVIVRSTVELAHSLGLSVVAEGVEDGETLDVLTQLGCERLQGFHIARPMTEAALKSWLDAMIVRRATAATERLIPRQASGSPAESGEAAARHA